jgi:hypothetical protein
MTTGCCYAWYIGGQKYDEPLPHQFEPAQMGYTERPKEKGFGCKRCEYMEEDGNCKQWDFKVIPNACCYANEGPDDVTPGMEAYGTSEGVTKAWDTRGRGNKNTDYFSPQPDVPPNQPEDEERAKRYAMDDWVDDSNTIRKRAKAIITTGKDSVGDLWDKEAHVILNGIRNGTEIKDSIYRGVGASSHSMAQYMSLKVGDNLQLAAPSSFSKDLSTARSFAMANTEPTDGRVIFEIEGGAKGIDVNELGGDESAAKKYEHEVITNGKFEVTDVLDHKILGGMTYRQIRLKQLGTL